MPCCTCSTVAGFWHKVLFDRGYLPSPEPFQKLVNQGMILGDTDYHVPAGSSPGTSIDHRQDGTGGDSFY